MNTKHFLLKNPLGQLSIQVRFINRLLCVKKENYEY